MRWAMSWSAFSRVGAADDRVGQRLGRSVSIHCGDCANDVGIIRDQKIIQRCDCWAVVIYWDNADGNILRNIQHSIRGLNCDFLDIIASNVIWHFIVVRCDESQSACGGVDSKVRRIRPADY
jgi:hypothetical protein